MTRFEMLALYFIIFVCTLFGAGMLTQWYECYSCGGTFVRTLFWFVCLK